MSSRAGPYRRLFWLPWQRRPGVAAGKGWVRRLVPMLRRLVHGQAAPTGRVQATGGCLLRQLSQGGISTLSFYGRPDLPTALVRDMQGPKLSST